MSGVLQRGRNQEPIQALFTDPVKCLGTKASGTIFKVKPTASDSAAIAAGTTVDVTNWLCVVLYPTADGQVAYNGDAAKVEPIYSGQQNVFFLHPSTTQLSINTSCIVCGM